LTIVTCRECGKEISSKAVTCPHCGLVRKQSVGTSIGMMAGGCLLVIVGLIMLSVASVAYLALQPSSSTAIETIAKQPNPSAKSWNPSDPDQPYSKVQFSLRFAQKLRGLQTLAEVQKAAGSLGKITDRHLDSDDPTVTYHWDGEGPSYLLSIVRPSGWITTTVMTRDDVQITLDNRGTFLCFPSSCRN